MNDDSGFIYLILIAICITICLFFGMIINECDIRDSCRKTGNGNAIFVDIKCLEMKENK